MKSGPEVLLCRPEPAVINSGSWPTAQNCHPRVNRQHVARIETSRLLGPRGDQGGGRELVRGLGEEGQADVAGLTEGLHEFRLAGSDGIDQGFYFVEPLGRGIALDRTG